MKTPLALPNHFESVESITALEQVMGSSVNNAVWVPATFLALYQEGDKRLAAYFAAPDENGNRKSSKGGKREFSCTFRVGELYLNAAEAAANMDKLPHARSASFRINAEALYSRSICQERECSECDG